MKYRNGLMLLGAVVVFLLGRAVAEEEMLSVRSIQIVNGAGEPVVVLGVDDQGRGQIFINSENSGQTVIGFHEGPVIQQSTADGLQTHLTGGGGFAHLNEESIDVVTLGLNDKGTANLRLGGNNGGVSINSREVAVNTFGEMGDLQNLAVAGTNAQGDGIFKSYTSKGAPAWASDGLVGDLNADGEVDFSDFTIFARQFGKSRQ